MMEKIIVENKAALYRQAADRIIGVARDRVAEQGRFTLVLAGGNTPKGLYTLLRQSPYQQEFPWQQTYFFWGDERCVPPDHEHSNYAMAYQTLLGDPGLGIPNAHIHPMMEKVQTPEKAAQQYELKLKNFFNLGSQQHWPVFDLILLGMGADGHTLSLFPGDDHHSSGYRRLVVQLYAPTGNPPGHRLSLTVPVVNQARHVMFLVTGRDKRPIIREIWTNQLQAQKRFPAALIEPKGQLLWLVDQEAGDISQP